MQVCNNRNPIARLARGFACWLLVLSVVGCGSSVRGTAFLGVDHSSARSLVISFHQACVAKDFGAMLECMEPDYQPQYDRFLISLKACSAAAGEFVKTVRQYVGQEEAEMVRRVYRVPISPFAAVASNGRIDWRRVHFSRSAANIVDVTIGSGSPLRIQKDGDCWFISGESDGYAVIRNPMLKIFYDEGRKGIEALTRKAQRGEVNKKDLMKELSLEKEKGDRLLFGDRAPGRNAFSRDG